MVQKLKALSYSELVCSAARMNEEESEIAFTLPGKVIQVEWVKSFSLDENINRNLNGQNNSRTRLWIWNYFFLLQCDFKYYY